MVSSYVSHWVKCHVIIRKDDLRRSSQLNISPVYYCIKYRIQKQDHPFRYRTTTGKLVPLQIDHQNQVFLHQSPHKRSASPPALHIANCSFVTDSVRFCIHIYRLSTHRQHGFRALSSRIEAQRDGSQMQAKNKSPLALG